MPTPNLKDIKAAIDRTLATQQQRKAIMSEQDRQNIVAAVSGAIAPLLTPYLQAMVEASRKAGQDNKEVMREAMAVLREELSDSLKGLKLDGITADIRMPDITVPEIHIPEIKVPQPIVNFTAPKLDVLDIVRKIQFPDEMNIRGFVQLQGVSLQNPLPVQIRDANGAPVSFGGNSTILSSSGGGKTDHLTIKGFDQSAFSQITNPDGRLKVELPTGSSGLTDTELRAAHLDVQQVSGSIDSVKVTGFDTSIAASLVDSSGVQYSGSNPFPVAFSASATSASNIVDSTGVAYEGSNPFPVTGTVLVSDVTNSLKSALIDSTGVQYSGSNPVPVNVVSQSLASSASALVDSSGVQYSGSNPVPITGTVLVSDITNSIKSALVDSSGVQYSGSNPVPVVVSNAGTSVVAVPQTVAGANIYAIDDGGWVNSSPGVPILGVRNDSFVSRTSTDGDYGAVMIDAQGRFAVRVTGIAQYITGTELTSEYGVKAVVVGDSATSSQTQFISRTTNPTAIADGSVVFGSADDLGRQINRPIQARDLIKTAYATFATGTEATLLAGTAAKYNDLIYILAANNSTAAVGIDIRPSTAGSIVMHLEIPANGVTGVSLPVPIPQQATGDGTGGTWTVDLPDITGTTVSVSALFSQEI